ncbi:MAG: pitrilysin family protein [Cyanobacteria bacterium P01_G01_bin.54]
MLNRLNPWSWLSKNWLFKSGFFNSGLSRWGLRSLLLLGTLLLVISSAQTVAAAPAKFYTELEFPPLRELELPDYERYELDNGIVVYLFEDHELPLIEGQALFRTGDRLEPLAQTGLGSLTGTVWRTGGTTEHTPNEINEFLEQRAAAVETGIGVTSASVSFSLLTEDTADVFRLFAELVQQPTFNADKVALAKQQVEGSIARRNDDPDDIGWRELDKLIYGQESPYARTIEYATLGRIEREDLVQFYRQSIRPEQMILGIVGDFEPAAMKQLIAEQFGAWQPAPTPPLSALPRVTAATTGGVFLVEQPQLTQSYISLGHLGGQVNDPNYPALSVLNGVLNGFGGRLFNELRSRQGLAYSVFGYWSPQYDYPGRFIAGGHTRTEATVPFIQGIFQELATLQAEPISAAELAYAKESILNSFVFNFQSPGQLMSRLMRYEYYGYPADFVFQYQRGIKATTIADVQRVAQAYLKPEQITTLVVGNPAAMTPPLESLGTDIQTIDITIPGS